MNTSIAPTKISGSTDLKIETVVSQLQSAAKSLHATCRLIVEILSEEPAAYDRLKERTGLHDAAIERMQRVGLGKLDERLLMDFCPAAARLEQLPIEQQRQWLNDCYGSGASGLFKHSF